MKTVRPDAGPSERRRTWPAKCLVVVALNFLPTILAGHGYDLGNSSRESGWDDGVAGISTMWILAAIALALFAVGLIVWLNPSSRATRKLKAIAPELGLVAFLVAAAFVTWQVLAETTGNSPSLIVERVEAGLDGGPELLVSLGEDDLNTLKITNGKKIVRVECVGRKGEVVLAARHKWPFVDEAGYDYPHAHQPASRDDLRRADRCRLRGTTHRLEADVEGVLTRSAL